MEQVVRQGEWEGVQGDGDMVIDEELSYCLRGERDLERERVLERDPLLFLPILDSFLNLKRQENISPFRQVKKSCLIQRRHTEWTEWAGELRGLRIY